MNTGGMGKYCLKPHPVYFNNAFPMWQQVLGPVQYIINNTYSTSQSTIWENILRARKIFSRAKGE